MDDPDLRHLRAFVLGLILGLAIVAAAAAATVSAATLKPAALLRPADRVDKCAGAFLASLNYNGMPASVRALLPKATLAAGVRTFCANADSAGVINARGDVTTGAAFVSFLHAHPEAFKPLCLPLAYAARAVMPLDVAKDLTAADWRSYATTFCRWAPFYVRSDGHLDTTSLLREHPEIALRFCAAGFLSDYDSDPGSYKLTRNAVRSAALGFCQATMRAGLLVYHGGSNFTFTKNATYYALVRRYFG